MKISFRMPFVLNALMIQLLVLSAAYGQSQKRKLSNLLNHPSYNTYAPYLSADANAIVFLSDNAEDYLLTPFYSFREGGDWSEPKQFPKVIYSRLASIKDFSLSADGRVVFFSTLRTPSVGGFDIWMSSLKGNTWQEPVNLAKPINSAGPDCGPSISADGKTLYFTRCQKMNQSSASGCTIFKSAMKPNGQWGEPEELPSYINTGNSQSPRIMADGETLIFSSDQIKPGRGGMDLYISKLENGVWKSPRPLDFVNTESDDQYISVAALGRYLVRDEKGKFKNEMVEYLIPDQLRPKGMMRIEGKVSDEKGAPIASYISIYDLQLNKRVYSGRPYTDGSFMTYLKEGSVYELAIDPEQDNVSFFVQNFDLTGADIPQVKQVSAVIKPLAVNDEFVLEGVCFKDGSADIDQGKSISQLRKFARSIKANPNFRFEFQVLLDGYVEDSVQSTPDLTEFYTDSISASYEVIDSLGAIHYKDTVYARTVYHNDRTWEQAASLVNYFIEQGIDPVNLSAFGNAIPATVPEEQKLLIKAVVRKL